MTRSRTSPALLLVLAVPLVLAGCGGAEQVPADQAVPLAVAGGPSAHAHAPGGLATASTSVGTVVTSDGRTLYRFAADSADPSTATCEGDCATAWPPVLGDGVPAVDGVDPALVGTVGRSDGTQQLTLGGWPLYRYAKDAAPGDVTGDGVGGTWQAIGVDGKPAAPAADSASGGY